MSKTSVQTVHAEHVGSLLRPKALLDARQRNAEGSLSNERLRELEDEASLAAIEMQRDAGVEVFTDGEVRRGSFMAGMCESLGGVVTVDTDQPWRRGEGSNSTDIHEDMEFGHVVVNGKLTQKAQLTSREAELMAVHSPGPYKITMVSASMGMMLWDPNLSTAAYPHPGVMLDDLISLQAAEIDHLVSQGVTWLQLDSLNYTMVIDSDFRARLMGDVDPQQILDGVTSVDQQLIARAKAENPDVIVGVHVCRGNHRSAWLAKGGYDAVAEQMFDTVKADRFLLEYDTSRSGDFRPLRFSPPGTTIVLGLISTKVPELESRDELLRRIDEASKYVAIEDLGISPQCGFASTAVGNLLSFDDERRKLELVADIAQAVWGGAGSS